MSHKRQRHTVEGLLLILLLTFVTPSFKAQSFSTERATTRRTIAAFVIYGGAGGLSCRQFTPTAAEADSKLQQFMQRQTRLPLHEITATSQRVAAQNHLQIILRATDQLEQFPAAKDAFVRAAETWETLLLSPITLVMDVDFGPTRFGEVFPPGVIGSAQPQEVGDEGLYPSVRARLLANASTPQMAALLNSLPGDRLPTDLGATAALTGTTAIGRALGLLAPQADPEGERAQLGDPPSIGFNSNLNWDFEPSDGIAAGKLDFYGTALHEMGHVLGFVSTVGATELDDQAALSPSVLDIFRFQLGVTAASFGSAPRLQASGGVQVFFAGDEQIPLSTGRADRTGGDEQQASHWKDDRLLGEYVGIMDPESIPGERDRLTEYDLDAFEAIGYRVNRAALQPVTRPAANVPAASFKRGPLCPDLLVSAFGTDLAAKVEVATQTPLPLSLAGTTVKIRDAAGETHPSPLFFVAPTQVNYLMPDKVARGSATVTITNSAGDQSVETLQIAEVSPGLFTANANGRGVPAAVLLRVSADGTQRFEPVARFDAGQNAAVPAPIDFGPESDQLFLILFGSGFRYAPSLAAVSVAIGGLETPVLFAGPQGGLAGLDQINLALPRQLAGRGLVRLELNVRGVAANSAEVFIR